MASTWCKIIINSETWSHIRFYRNDLLSVRQLASSHMFLQLATYLHINKVIINKEAVSYVSVTGPNELSQQFKST